MLSFESNNNAVVLAKGPDRLRIAFVSPSIARITFTRGKPFLVRPSLIVTSESRFTGYTLGEDDSSFTIATPELTLVVDKASGALRYLDASGDLLLTEGQGSTTGRSGRASGKMPGMAGSSGTSCSDSFTSPSPDGCGEQPPPIIEGRLKAKVVTRNVFREGTAIAAGQSIDGARARAAEFDTVFDRHAFEARLDFEFAGNEALFGLGSHEEGVGNLRGKSRDLYQQNMKMVVPHLVSSKGYGILWDCCSLMTFHDDEGGSYWWADTVDELDYYFLHGGSFDGVTNLYHQLTGPAPMLPKWAFGFIQSKERYVNDAELIEVAGEYRRRRIPLDAVVLDWKSWPNGSGWGQKSFDPARFPDPSGMTSELHAMGARLMVSIWPIMTNGCPDQNEMLEHGKMLGNQATYDAFDPIARKVYWEQANRGLFAHGVDAWWCDCTEPFEADWSGAVKPDPEERLRVNTGEAAKYIDRGLINAYSLPHSQGIYDGQRAQSSAKRVLNLTRSSYAGQHRYATVCWNGDICATWETLRRCIPEGVNFCATGEPYWTTDIGGFFINNDPDYWFWRGDYPAGCRGLTGMDAMAPDPADTGCSDLGFHELYTRWMQYAVFLPMFRSHGTDAAREIWRFGEAGNAFYDAIAGAIHLRYQLLPYLYTLASEVTHHGRMMLRAIALDFPDDPVTGGIDDQFLCGPSLLVCPVTRPMFYGPDSQPLHDVPQSRQVYLPVGCDWYDFHTGDRHSGGQTITAAAPLASIPVFVRAGTILPIGPVVQHTGEYSPEPIELRVYPGADAGFSLYDDAGDGYGYEQGEYTLTPMHWDDATRQLTISERQGAFPGMAACQDFRVALADQTGSPDARIPRRLDRSVITVTL